MSLKVLFVIAEMAPLVKVGGLGDVGGALPLALRRLGLDVRVALPWYAALDKEQASSLRPLAALPDGTGLWRADVRGVPVYLVEQERSFGREQVYGHPDDAARFLAFCDGLLAAATAIDWRPELLHLHDWHAGFLAARLAGDAEHPWTGLPLVFTIHNLGITGTFDTAFAAQHRLPAQALEAPAGLPDGIAFSGLAQGILHAEQVSTVSPTYAREILTPEYGGDLAPLLLHRRERLAGIMNGIDTEEYDPAGDPHLAARFDAARLDRRVENKRALQQQLGLPVDVGVPLLGMVSRLYSQKGPDLAVETVERLPAEHNLQFAVLGQGDPEQERALTELARRHPLRAAVRIAFDAPLGQLIYGGCDLFLMPSRYEPCGLGQLIAMRYGAVPVVRRTGGLADSVTPYDAASDRGTGFLFDEPSSTAFGAALEEALAVYQDRAAWRRLQLRCMAQDFSWERAARGYGGLYRQAQESSRERVDPGGGR